ALTSPGVRRRGWDLRVAGCAGYDVDSYRCPVQLRASCATRWTQAQKFRYCGSSPPCLRTLHGAYRLDWREPAQVVGLARALPHIEDGTWLEKPRRSTCTSTNNGAQSCSSWL